jgi:hypothetical protein
VLVAATSRRCCTYSERGMKIMNTDDACS